MKKIFGKLIAALCIASIATSAVAIKINAPADINNFGPAVVSAMSGLYVSPSRQILTSSPLSGGGDLTADRTISLGTLGTAGTYGDATHTNVITTDAYGRISAITPTTITNVSGNAATATALATGRTISITGDLAYTSPSFTGAGNVTAAGTLATVNSNIGACGDATHVGVVTLNAKGLTTACTATTITGVPASTAVTLATPRTIAIQTGDVTSPGASFDGSASETATATLATVNSNVGTFGSASAVPNITVNGKGLITAVTTSALGTAATQNTGTSGATIPLLNGTNTWSGAQTVNAQLNVNTSGSTNSILVTDTGANGAGIKLTGNGATTPSKFIRSFSGSLQVVNSANSAVILGLNDAGGLSVPSSIVSSGSFVRPGVTTVAGLATVDSSPQAGDMLVVSDAAACTTNTTPTGGGSTTCPLAYSGAAWKAIVTH